jgi:hypothetical protein
MSVVESPLFKDAVESANVAQYVHRNFSNAFWLIVLERLEHAGVQASDVDELELAKIEADSAIRALIECLYTKPNDIEIVLQSAIEQAVRSAIELIEARVPNGENTPRPLGAGQRVSG